MSQITFNTIVHELKEYLGTEIATFEHIIVEKVRNLIVDNGLHTSLDAIQVKKSETPHATSLVVSWDSGKFFFHAFHWSSAGTVSRIDFDPKDVAPSWDDEDRIADSPVMAGEELNREEMDDWVLFSIELSLYGIKERYARGDNRLILVVNPEDNLVMVDPVLYYERSVTTRFSS